MTQKKIRIACEGASQMDIDPKYVAVAVKRWESYTGQKAEKLK